MNNDEDLESYREVIDPLSKILNLFEKRLDAQEQILAKMVLAYQEIWATLEATIQTMVNGFNEDQQKEFVTLLEELKSQSLKKMAETIENLAGDTEETEPTDTDITE